MNSVNFYIYEQNGKIVRVGSTTQSDIQLNVADGQRYGIGEATLDRHYVDNGHLIELPEKPGDNYLFDYTSKTWQPDILMATTRAIEKRNQLLANGPDRVNPLWWAAMSTTEKAEVAEYRQALLDITNQQGYPIQIDWPPVPWMFST
jgi:hypothetical protein